MRREEPESEVTEITCPSCGFKVRATWSFSVTGDCAAVTDLSAVHTIGPALYGTAQHRFRSDLPGTLLDRLDVITGTSGRRPDKR
jgi:hypothetical protein